MGPLAMAVDPREAQVSADGSSCMKWGQDGELSPVDLQRILERLSAVDEQASRLMNCSLDGAA